MAKRYIIVVKGADAKDVIHDSKTLTERCNVDDAKEKYRVGMNELLSGDEWLKACRWCTS